MNNRSRSTFVVVFAVTYAVVYAFAAKFNWPLFTFGPQTGEFGWLLTPASAGPSMVYYGWIATAVLCAAPVAAVLALRPTNQHLWHGLAWAVPILGMLFFANALKGYLWFQRPHSAPTPAAALSAEPPRGITPTVIAAEAKPLVPPRPEPER